MRRVLIESPFKGKGSDTKARKIDELINTRYARVATHDSLMRGEAPFTMHLLYTQEGILNDDYPDERDLGIAAGLAWGESATASAFYIDLGVSTGMRYGLRNAQYRNRVIELRSVFDRDAVYLNKTTESLDHLYSLSMAQFGKGDVAQFAAKQNHLRNMLLNKWLGWCTNKNFQ